MASILCYKCFTRINKLYCIVLYCMVEDIHVWKIGGCTLVVWKSRRVERLKENSMWF